MACALGDGNSFKKKRKSIKANSRLLSTPLLSANTQSKSSQSRGNKLNNKSNKRPSFCDNVKEATAGLTCDISVKNSDIIEAGEGLCLLLEQCLSPDPSKRPQLSTLLSSGSHSQGLKWLKAFQDVPLRFGHAFGKPKMAVSKRDLVNMRSEGVLR